jgi:hypothetical protein
MTPRLLVIDTGASETNQPRLGRTHARAERRARYRVRKDASQSTFRIETALAARAERPQRTRGAHGRETQANSSSETPARSRR